MKKLFSVLFALALLALLVTPSLAITNGQHDGDAHPNVGLILRVNANGELRPTCTGTLISPTVFLTAAHCTSFLEGLLQSGALTSVMVSFDTDNAYEDGHIPVLDIDTHPGFRPNPGTGVGVNDVGVLILNEDDTSGIPLATLPAEGFLDDLQAQGLLRQGSDGAGFVAVGYGTVLTWPPPVIADGGGIRRRSVSEFSNLRSQWLQMSQNQAPGNGNGGTCYGDSGGPNFWVEDDGTEVLVSVTSWGDVPCVATNITQRVDSPSVVSYLDGWLE